MSLCAGLALAAFSSSAGTSGRSFTVQDDIEMVRLQEPPVFSPDGKYFYVVAQRGLLDKNVPEYTVWVWTTAEVAEYARNSSGKKPPEPLPLSRVATYKDGPMNGMRFEWLADSSGIVYAARSDKGTFRLFRSDLATHTPRALTPAEENVTGFTFQGSDYLYSSTIPAILQRAEADSRSQMRSITGESIMKVLHPLSEHPDQIIWSPYSEVWAVIGGKRFRVENRKSHEPLHLIVHATAYSTEAPFKLSPERRSLVALMPVDELPQEWVQYQAPTGYESLRGFYPIDIFGRKQSVNPFDPSNALIEWYRLIDLTTGIDHTLVNAPSGRLLDWNADLMSARWSPDGKALLLSNTFLPLDGADSKERAERAKHPCLAVFDLPTRKISCVLPLIAGLDPKRFGLQDARFDPQDPHRVIVDYTAWRILPKGKTSTVFRRQADGAWIEEGNSTDPALASVSFDLKVRQSVNDPPLLTVADKTVRTDRVLWDPTPQLRDIAWGEVSLIQWKDSSGADYTANLLKPPGYMAGHRYPLVIQTHGSLSGNVFIASGVTTTGFAAREMAAAGMVVVQMGWNAKHFGGPEEGADQVEAFASLIDKLNQEGLIDPDKVGLIGWSRSVYHTYAALAAGRPKLAAASVIEGVNYGYWQFLQYIDSGSDNPGSGADQAKKIFGAAPFGAGLQTWIQHSPIFNLSKATPPLLMLETGPDGVLSDWEPYAALYYQHRPVDLVLLQAGEHIQSNPQQRLATQGTTVDWYRFWLQGYEDPDSAKAEQYARWRRLRDMQHANEAASGSTH